MQVYDVAKLGLPYHSSMTFIAKRKKSVLGRPISEATSCNRNFMPTIWALYGSNEVYEDLLGDAPETVTHQRMYMIDSQNRMLRFYDHDSACPECGRQDDEFCACADSPYQDPDGREGKDLNEVLGKVVDDTERNIPYTTKAKPTEVCIYKVRGEACIHLSLIHI